MRNLLFVFLFMPAVALACENKFDCALGSECVKNSRFDRYGICVGRQAGNDHDRNPVYNKLDRNDLIGKTCSFDTECGLQRKCHKQPASLQGVCR